MSWNSATGVLYSAKPTTEQIEALKKFALEHVDDLKRCYAPEFRDQRPILCKFVSRLFVILESQHHQQDQKLLNSVVEQIAGLLVREEFFKGVFHSALFEGDLALLELVFSSLFTEIIFNSSLTALWFKEKLAAERAAVEISDDARAFITLITTQFLDVKQDWAIAKPKSDLLLALQESIGASQDKSAKLSWALALYFMAQQHYADDQNQDDENDGDDGIEIEPLMTQLQQKAGAHWSQIIKYQLQVSLSGLESLVNALERVRTHRFLQFVSTQLLSQVVADTVSSLFAVSKPTDTLCAALATAVEPHPALQRVPWISAEHLALIKSKCPANIGSVVSTAQVLDIASRIDYLSEMRTYVSVIAAENLDINDRFLENPKIGCDVRTTSVVSVLPPRSSDHQGTLELAPNTKGTLLACEGNDCLVMWYFTYNGWSLLGRLLENADLKHGNAWQALDREILKLISITVDIPVLAAMSAGLARGDIVDLVVNRLQSWVHDGVHECCDLAFDFLVQFARVDPARVWALLHSVVWTISKPVLDGLRRVLVALWPSFDPTLSLHNDVVSEMTQLFMSRFYMRIDLTTLEVCELFLPFNTYLREIFLSASWSSATEALITNLDEESVLKFCKFCIALKSSAEAATANGATTITTAAGTPASLPVSTPAGTNAVNSVGTNVGNSVGTSAGTSVGTAIGKDTIGISNLEKELFAKTTELTQLLLGPLQTLVLELWIIMLDNPQAPSLLAFLDKSQATTLKNHLVETLDDKLESSETVALIARFLYAARRQESMLSELRDLLLPRLESRLPSINDSESFVAVVNSLTLAKHSLKPETLEVLESKIRDPEDSALTVKIVSIEALIQQIQIDPKPLTKFVEKMDTLTPELVVLKGIRPSLHSHLITNLRNKWPALAFDEEHQTTLDIEKLDTLLSDDEIWQISYRPEVERAIKDRELIELQTKLVNSWCQLIIAAVKSDYSFWSPSLLHKWAVQLLNANSNALPVPLQRAEDERTVAALVILQDPRCELDVDLLSIVYHQLTDLTLSPNAGLPALKPRLKAAMKMAALILTRLVQSSKQVDDDGKLVPILIGLLDVVVIKQVQLFGLLEEDLQLHLLILRDSLKLLSDKNHRPHELVESMIESGSDRAILKTYYETPASNPFRGELIFLCIQEWIRSRVLTDNFVRNGLMNVLVEAPLSRLMQAGGIVATTHPALHSLWRRGILPTVSRLQRELESRISEEASLFVETYANQFVTCLNQWKAGQINVALIEEMWLINVILRSASKSYLEQNGVRFDEEELKKTIDVLLSHQNYLSSRISATADEAAVKEALQSFQAWLQ